VVILNGRVDAFNLDESNSSALLERYGFTMLIHCGHSAIGASGQWRMHLDVSTIHLASYYVEQVLRFVPLFDPFDFAGPCCKLAKHTTQRGINQPRRLFEISFVRFDINARSPRSSALPPRGRLSSRSQLISQQPFVRWLTGGTRSAPMSFPLARRGLANRRSDGALRHAYVLMHECYAATPERNMPYHAYSPWSARLGGKHGPLPYRLGDA
jgi:hypothetical protein